VIDRFARILWADPTAVPTHLEAVGVHLVPSDLERTVRVRSKVDLAQLQASQEFEPKRQLFD